MQTFRTISIVAGLLLLPCALFAVDGVILIDQNKAMAGGVTPGDTPGFPVTISQPGSYRLDGNLTLPDINTTAIRVQADNVTIDLNGFSIIGPSTCPADPFIPTGCTVTEYGIDATAANNLTVSNGMISGINGVGILTQGSGTHIEKVHVSNSYTGIVVASGTISDCIVQSNLFGMGVNPIGAWAIITNVVALSNTQVGFAGAGRVSNSIFVTNNTGLEITGAYVGNLFFGNSQDVIPFGNNPAFDFGGNVCHGVPCVMKLGN